MRYFIVGIVLILAYAGCSSTEPIQQEETEQETAASVPTATPPWYSADVHSNSDSLAIHGYSLASAADSVRAVELSTQTALKYLRFEIDRSVDEIRENLADSPEGSEIYASSSFIIRLRNTILELPLHSAELAHEHESPDGKVHFSYTRATISRVELYTLLESELEDSRFLEQLKAPFFY